MFEVKLPLRVLTFKTPADLVSSMFLRLDDFLD